MSAFNCFLIVLTLGGTVASAQAPTSPAPVSERASSPTVPRAPQEVTAELPDAKLVGVARMRFFGLQVYTARLWAPAGFSRQAPMQTAFALELQYGLSLKGERIADRSMDEIQAQGALPADKALRWRTFMVQTFADVNKGDRLVGMHQPGGTTRFWLNGVRRGEQREPEFAQRFFDIWLSAKTSEPAMRDALLSGMP
jgi:hypothetical protein